MGTEKKGQQIKIGQFEFIKFKDRMTLDFDITI